MIGLLWHRETIQQRERPMTYPPKTICGINLDLLSTKPTVEEVAQLFEGLSPEDQAEFFLLADDSIRRHVGLVRSQALWQSIGLRLAEPEDGTEGGCPMVEEIGAVLARAKA